MLINIQKQVWTEDVKGLIYIKLRKWSQVWNYFISIFTHTATKHPEILHFQEELVGRHVGVSNDVKFNFMQIWTDLVQWLTTNGSEDSRVE